MGVASGLIAMQEAGDCLYRAVEMIWCALHENRLGFKVDVKFLRQVVADSIKEEQFNQWKMFLEAGCRDYQFMKRIKTLPQLQQEVLKMGPNGGVWAEQYAIQQLADFSCVHLCTFLISIHPKSAIFYVYLCPGILDQSQKQPHYLRISPRYNLQQARYHPEQGTRTGGPQTDCFC
eukprot:TRINITY_DN9230_c0_g1_i2.p1 TRINITY_DN9230_c0_g1~~TRINITY_DN9230_c0_g1_i2.p1  ORF type:complete len:176 (-),score=19.76 TRINITY_DN9230_c0_g1_i2:304-831(-)